MLPMAPNNNMLECSETGGKESDLQRGIRERASEQEREMALYGFRPNLLPYYE